MRINKNDKLLQTPSGLWPNMLFPLASPGTSAENLVGRDIANDYYKPRDFELLKYLYFFRFVTFEQLCKLLKVAADEETTFRSRLQQLASRRIINRFTMSSDKDKTVDDGNLLTVYTLDYVGCSVLNHRYSKNNIINYEVAMNISDSVIVTSQLFIVNIYISLIESLGKENVVAFDASPDFPLTKNFGGEHGRAQTVHYCPGFTFTVRNKDGENKSYVCDVFNKEQLGQDIIDEVRYANQYLPRTKSYMPISANADDSKKAVATYLVFVPENEDILVATSCIINYGDNIKTFRLATEDSIKNGLGEPGAFFKFDPEKNSVVPVTMGSFKKEA